MTQTQGHDAELHPEPLPVIPLPQEPFLPRGKLQRLVNRMPGAQFFRYACVGGFNTLFGYTTYAILLTLLNSAMPARFLYLTVVLASLLSNPLNITVAYLGYKFIVFKTKGNYLREWFKCFAVYGTSMIPGLLALSALTHFFQRSFHRHAAILHRHLSAFEAHLGGGTLHMVQHAATGKNMAGYIAGALVIGVSTIYSFVGHKKVTFRTRTPA